MIIFEDEFLIVIDKPAGVPSQPTMDPRRASALSLVQEVRPGVKIWLHHRLDRDTSGVLVFSKSQKANKGLTDIFRDHKLQKTYLALCKPPKVAVSEEHTGGLVVGSTWELKNHLIPVRDPKKKLQRMVEVKSGGWYAETHFECLALNEKFMYVRAKPITGRTHQIRVHLALGKTPILGDFLYGGKSTLADRCMLHASELIIKHPVTQKELCFRAELPRDFSKLLE